jgi:polar amino acid transport system substrate-binding protein
LTTLSFSATKVVVYTDDDFRPYSYFDNNRAKGIHADIIRAIFAKMRDFTVELRPIDWAEGLTKMKKGEIFILNNLYHRPIERPYITDYSTPYMEDHPAIYCNKKIPIKNPDSVDWSYEFDGITIGKRKGISLSSSISFRQAIKDKRIKIIEDAHDRLLTKLIEKKIDCYMDEDLFIQGALLQKQREYKEENKTTDSLDAVNKLVTLEAEGIHLGFSKKYFSKRNNLLKKINLAIKVMKNGGDIEKIRERYLVEYLTQDNTKKSIDASIFPLGSFVSDKINNYGILADIVTTAFAQRDIEINFHYYDRNEAYLYNKWGKACMSFPWTKGVDSWLYNDLSDPIMTSDISFFYDKVNLPDGIKYDNLYDLKDYHIGGIKGAFYEQFFSGMSFEYTSFDNVKELLTALTLKKIDIVPMNRYLFVDALKEYMPHKLEEFAHHEKPMTKKANYILFSRNCRDSLFFRDEFNKGFEKIQRNGLFDKILDKYTTTDQEKKEFTKIFRNLKEIEKAEKASIFDLNTTQESNLSEGNATELNATMEPILKPKSYKQ